MRRKVLSPREMARLGWTRTDPRPWSKLSARWISRSCWRLEHCGHPTANWPWALYDRRGRLILTGVLHEDRNPDFGVAWPTLEQAARWVADHGEAFLAGIPVAKSA